MIFLTPSTFKGLVFNEKPAHGSSFSIEDSIYPRHIEKLLDVGLESKLYKYLRNLIKNSLKLKYNLLEANITRGA
jgi:hypothetical protein